MVLPKACRRGVVQCVAEVARKVGADQVEMVTHSTTQAVNALLEGDVGTVGIVGMGRRPELAKARKRTELAKVELSAGKHLATVPVFLDVTDGLDESAAAALQQLLDRGVSAIATAEAFAPDGASNETRVAQMAASLGLPSCASTDLSGLYGLELRAVTAAVNASIMPIALRTASHVEEGVNAAGIDAPIMVMRGDGGATDLAGFKAAPARTLYSGPAASVAGALRYTGVRDGIVVEVGGTSTNVAGVKLGRPSLSYVTVALSAVISSAAVDIA
jgi:N-methylhydantoinase A/oxoprolinase/acetone carboxylase beta subunit